MNEQHPASHGSKIIESGTNFDNSVSGDQGKCVRWIQPIGDANLVLAAGCTFDTGQADLSSETIIKESHAVATSATKLVVTSGKALVYFGQAVRNQS